MKGLEERRCEFINSIKDEKTLNMLMLNDIKKRISTEGVNVENVHRLTKDLTYSQKEQLKELYREKLNSLNKKIEEYKNRIFFIKKTQ